MPVPETDRRAPGLPDKLAPLSALARDLRWTWRPDLKALFSAIHRETWRKVRGNALAFLSAVPAEHLTRAAEDPAYQARLSEALAGLAAEDAAEPDHPAASQMASRGERVAYFSAEFGLTDTLPIYAGGLGVLAGDHLKSSSDLAVPLVGVGLFYREGYFRQRLDPHGRQQEENPVLDPEELPLLVPEVPGGGAPVVTVPIAGREVRLLIRLARVGRVPLLLLDANLPENDPADRDITSRLYGGDQENRIRQEIVLGIGGLRALDRLNLRPTVRHMNEGHAAFVALERIRQLIREENLSFAEARELAAAGNVFTTHTPVPAGLDRFSREMLLQHLGRYLEELQIPFEDFVRLGNEVPDEDVEFFSMAAFALRLSAHANAVSQLHARVARQLWSRMMPALPPEEVPIHPITNGVHPATWTAPEIASLRVAENAEGLDRAEFWRRHEGLRARLVRRCRQNLVELEGERGASPVEIEAAAGALDPEALTIGFARRFATYKRAALIFRDPERLARLLHQPGRPVQLIFAGKAHPQDEPGKEMMHAVVRFTRLPEFRGKVVFLPEYGLSLARALVAGCDVWLNNPIRPLEASGTSGMKAALNGALNLSVLDGWWDEAPYEQAGFAIGEARDHAEEEEVARALYQVLESDVIPLFFERDAQGLPARWIQKMVQSASQIARLFSSDRMVTEYLEFCYWPAAERIRSLSERAAAARTPAPSGLRE
ncbi:MAG: alpha-glucan family phosphorylase [Thermoanaerobaculia bacterium]